MDPNDPENPSDETSDAAQPGDRVHPPNRWQFGLRKLMLWTAVVALWCGAYASLPPFKGAWGPLHVCWWAATPWFAIAAAVQGTIGPNASAVVSAALGLILGIAIAVWAAVTEGSVDLVIGLTMVAICLGFIGLAIAGLAKLAFECVNYLDTKLAGKQG